jgi:DNA replication protein DnaC
MLNRQQQVVKNIVEFMESDSTMHIINGSAGSGKSYLINYLCNGLFKNKVPIITTPTNKACQVLRLKLERSDLEIETFYKVLGLTIEQI